jgi:uncharacterized protein (DUF924 family)
MGWPDEVLGFWFGLTDEQWFKADEALDAEVRKRFEELYQEQRSFPADHFLSDPRTALAAVVLFDQLPRNMYRGHADQFGTDLLALQIAKGAVAREFDQALTPPERGILYMPFQHSESLDDQRQSLLLFTDLGEANQLEFAQKHHDVIARFGRFPHRNAMLGRQPRAEELAAGDVTPF